MEWITRTGARLDRAAMIWLIRNHIDPDATFSFLPEAEVIDAAGERGATPFHHPQAELRNTGLRTGFDSLIYRYELTDPALTTMALALRGAETNDRQITPWSTGLRAIATGLRSSLEDDERFVAAAGTVLDGLYAFCRELTSPAASPSRG
ncbi:MAG TPA: chromate resistance protein ChrB domain-containing protein [Thermomicrobiales bacterium]|jgi:hypothetical protein|nr:chromate resistance protein ChrB domain-containing protein [Thermomicrobiales bacterium]